MSDPSFPYDVFLSHSTKDKAVGHPLAERLSKDGLKVWFDEWVLKPGHIITRKIETALEPAEMHYSKSCLEASVQNWRKKVLGGS